jgi:hypothetical protein
LCHDCEEKFNVAERHFSNVVFYAYHKNAQKRLIIMDNDNISRRRYLGEVYIWMLSIWEKKVMLELPFGIR